MGRTYNYAYIIIENNEGSGQSINDTLFNTYDYDNLYRDRDPIKGTYKKYTGFRTTSKSRKQILALLQLFLDNKMLEVYDEDTIEQLFNFIEVNGKFQADEGYHDDLVLSLAFVFAPLIDVRGFDNQKLFIDQLFNSLENTDNDDNINNSELEFNDFFSFGDFDSEPDEDEKENYVGIISIGDVYEY